MNSLSIKRQLTSHFSILERGMVEKSLQRYELKLAKRKTKIEAGKRTKEVFHKQ